MKQKPDKYDDGRTIASMEGVDGGMLGVSHWLGHYKRKPSPPQSAETQPKAAAEAPIDAKQRRRLAQGGMLVGIVVALAIGAVFFLLLWFLSRVWLKA